MFFCVHSEKLFECVCVCSHLGEGGGAAHAEGKVLCLCPLFFVWKQNIKPTALLTEWITSLCLTALPESEMSKMLCGSLMIH